MASINEKLERIRKPRVHIKYDVETEAGVVEKQLPFVVGVLGDFSGQSALEKKPLKERKFINIDRDNFNEVMSRMQPGLNIRVENTLAADNSEMSLQLQFNKLEDFEPENLVMQVPALKELLDIRHKLRDLLTKADRSEALEMILDKTLQDQETLKKLAQDLKLLP